MFFICNFPLILSVLEAVYAFTSSRVAPVVLSQTNRQRQGWVGGRDRIVGISTPPPSSTALGMWWFGGTSLEQSTLQRTDDDSCELVPVRIERPSSNSRRILGEIVVPVPLEDVWAILTDYDRLAVHVPNLVESKIVERTSGGQQGDGSFRCRLFQKGAQKIVGFEFGASVTMDMREIAQDRPLAALPPSSSYASSSSTNGLNGSAPSSGKRERRIVFKCTDSFFFNEFDGEWKVVEQMGEDGSPESVLSYVVDVRPKGPVPVAALEWRIREDVPTNLRAVKKAAMEVGQKGVLAFRNPRMATQAAASSSASSAVTLSSSNSNKQKKKTPARRRMALRVQWDENETMAAYLEQKP
ncbi:hypothetical protein ACA910_012612 [Epithemia clementina (nom. ined.)]